MVVNGSWMKRSYGTNYDSLSGVGAIVGYHTRKVLFVGVRNKFCTVCDRAQRGGTEPKVHKCYKNFDRNASSTSMKSDAIVEGFFYVVCECMDLFIKWLLQVATVTFLNRLEIMIVIVTRVCR